MDQSPPGHDATYCNPLSLPHYQRGRGSFAKTSPKAWGWLHDPVRRDFREMADPTVVRFEDKWYLFPSAGMLWESSDLLNWTHRPIVPFDPGYAPTVVHHPSDGYLYLTASCDRMWRARHPLGPWEDLGHVLDESGQPFRWSDPMLFVDDDGTMYCYHGLGTDGIYVARMQRDNPTHFDGPRRHCFAFNPDHVWERKGEYNQDPTVSYIEGAWVTKRRGEYYLQYSANGTEWKNYGLGCYRSDSPLGPWRPQRRNPILLAPRGQGVVNGCAHHSLVEGPNDTLWCFYTTLVRNEHAFERRVGMDPAGFDENGDLFVAGPTETPQFAPGVRPDPARDNAVGLLPLTVNQPVRASASLPGRDAVYAVDDSIRTWWEAPAGRPQWIKVDLQAVYQVSAARTIFGDRGLNYAEGVVPSPYRYQLEASVDGETWTTVFTNDGSTDERHIAFDAFPTTPMRWVRLTVLDVPRGMSVSVLEFTAFGRHESAGD